jgi:hypothetical protein
MRTSLMLIGGVFAVLAAACAYVIALSEYRQRMLRLDQNPKRMALETALVTLAVMLMASAVLAIALAPAE